MTDQIGFFDAIYTQRAIRHLKPDPVPRETIEKLIEAGTKAPSGGNSQGWKFIVITDSETKKAIAEYYLKSWELAYGDQNPTPPTSRTTSGHRLIIWREIWPTFRCCSWPVSIMTARHRP
ncbi:MAG: nitroreductase family protein [Chloroflexi bacterium]|nr:nitroreductase family protein [Chloroflexota bacterium]